MATWDSDNTFITDVGYEILSLAQTGKLKFNISSIKASSDMNTTEELKVKTQFDGEVVRFAINNVTSKGNASIFNVEYVNMAQSEPFKISQIGIFVRDMNDEECLYFVAQTTQDGFEVIPPSQQFTRVKYSIQLHHADVDSIVVEPNDDDYIKHGEFDELYHEVQSLTNDINNIEADLGSSQESINEINTSLSNILGEINTLNGTSANIQDDMANHISESNLEFSGLKQEIDVVNDELVSLDDMVGELNSNISTIESDIGSIVEINKEQGNTIVELNDKLVEISSAINNKMEELEYYNITQDENITNISSELEESITKIDGLLGNISLENEKQGSDIITIQSNISEITDTLSGHTTDISNIKLNITELEKSVDTLNNSGFITIDDVPKIDLTDIENDIYQLKTLKLNTSEFNTKVEEIEDKINNLDIPDGVDLTPLNNAINELKAKDILLENNIKQAIVKYDDEIYKIWQSIQIDSGGDFNFDNLTNFKGSTRNTDLLSNGNIVETIYITSGNIKIATRETVFNNNDIEIIERVYDETGEVVKKQTSVDVVFLADGSIDEIIT